MGRKTTILKTAPSQKCQKTNINYSNLYAND